MPRTPLQCLCLNHFCSDQGELICTECNKRITEEVEMLRSLKHYYPVTHRKTEKGFEKLDIK